MLTISVSIGPHGSSRNGRKAKRLSDGDDEDEGDDMLVRAVYL